MAKPSGRMAPISKPKNFKQAMLNLISFCKKYMPAIILKMTARCCEQKYGAYSNQEFSHSQTSA